MTLTTVMARRLGQSVSKTAGLVVGSWPAVVGTKIKSGPKTDN